jgi:uncharacterized protein (DUF1810 family)
MAQRYATRSRSEAKAFLDHSLLGMRLIECTEITLQHSQRSPHDLFGSPDGMKFRSSLTLSALSNGGPSFAEALDVFYDGQRDAATERIFENWPDQSLATHLRLDK